MLGPKASLWLGIEKRLGQVMTDNETIELIVPVHQPIRCDCIIKIGFISKSALVKVVNNKVLVITG